MRHRRGPTPSLLPTIILVAVFLIAIVLLLTLGDVQAP